MIEIEISIPARMEPPPPTLDPSAPRSSTKPYPCTCLPTAEPGTVLLFYRYFSKMPVLPAKFKTHASTPEDLAIFHRDLAGSLDLTGKLRIAKEGFNITIAGPALGVAHYITTCISHWSFAGLFLDTQEERDGFFKPSPGCSCVFKDLSVKVCAEITPMGVTGYSPRDWDVVKEVEPGRWHKMLTSCKREDVGEREGKVVLLDVRNHYESSLGFFTTSSGVPAIRPQVRRFSQFPQLIKRRRIQGQIHRPKTILSYCTGGIRCEKATRFMAENLNSQDDVKVLTLKGGIAAYLSWVDGEIKAGRMTAKDSLFRGRNYVFDGRGSVGLESGGEEIVGCCHGCGSAADGMRKCKSTGCHLELVLCPSCTQESIFCCQDCAQLEAETSKGRIAKTPMCKCEREREAKLWGDQSENVELRKRDAQRKEPVGIHRKEQVNIQVQLIKHKA